MTQHADQESLPSEIDRYVVPLRLPKDQEVLAWLERQPSVRLDPQLVPTGWPESARMALLVVYRKCADLSHNCQTAGFLVTRPQAMNFLVDHCQTSVVPKQLWFRVPRRLFTTEICPELRAELWPDLV